MRTAEDEMYAGGWKALCAGVMMQAVDRLRGVSLARPGSRYHEAGNGGLDKEIIKQRLQARDWVAGGVGAITWEDCCESLGVDPGRARALLEAHIRARGSRFDAAPGR